MEKLTPVEISKRMQAWRNLKVLHKKAIKRNEKLVREDKKIKAAYLQAQERIVQLEQENQTIKIQLVELQFFDFLYPRKLK